mgnify:CR=1 FL=1
MSEENLVEEILDAPKIPVTFKEKWEAERIEKRAKKKAKKALVDKGYDPAIAANLVKTATKKVVSNKPVKKSAGRGR